MGKDAALMFTEWHKITEEMEKLQNHRSIAKWIEITDMIFDVESKSEDFLVKAAEMKDLQECHCNLLVLINMK